MCSNNRQDGTDSAVERENPYRILVGKRPGIEQGSSLAKRAVGGTPLEICQQPGNGGEAEAEDQHPSS